jgi:hypothetical protein
MLTLERINLLQSGDIELTKNKRLFQFDEEYDTCNNTFNSDDYNIAIKEYESLYEMYYNDITGFVILLHDGDIDEVWITNSLIPYDLQTEYVRLF